MIELEFQNTKIFLLKDTLKIGQNKFSLLVTLKAQLLVLLMLLVIYIVKKLVEVFYEKQLQKVSQEKFRIEKVIKRKGDKLYVKWKGYDNSFNSWIDEKDCV